MSVKTHREEAWSISNPQGALTNPRYTKPPHVCEHFALQAQQECVKIRNGSHALDS